MWSGLEVADIFRHYGGAYCVRQADPVDRRNPEIENAVNGCAEGNPLADPTEPHDASFRISEIKRRRSRPGFSSPFRGGTID